MESTKRCRTYKRARDLGLPGKYIKSNSVHIVVVRRIASNMERPSDNATSPARERPEIRDTPPRLENHLSRDTIHGSARQRVELLVERVRSVKSVVPGVKNKQFGLRLGVCGPAGGDCLPSRPTLPRTARARGRRLSAWRPTRSRGTAQPSGSTTLCKHPQSPPLAAQLNSWHAPSDYRTVRQRQTGSQVCVCVDALQRHRRNRACRRAFQRAPLQVGIGRCTGPNHTYTSYIYIGQSPYSLGESCHWGNCTLTASRTNKNRGSVIGTKRLLTHGETAANCLCTRRTGRQLIRGSRPARQRGDQRFSPKEATASLLGA